MKLITRSYVAVLSVFSTMSFAAVNPLAQAKHSGVYRCIWERPGEPVEMVNELNIEAGILHVNRDNPKNTSAGPFVVYQQEKSVSYFLTYGARNHRLTFRDDGTITMGVGITCTKE